MQPGARPPIGLKPFSVFIDEAIEDEEEGIDIAIIATARITNILEATQRYNQASKPIPNEWRDELEYYTQRANQID